MSGIDPEERVFVHTGFTDHLLQLHTVWSHTAQVLKTQTGEFTDGRPAGGATAATRLHLFRGRFSSCSTFYISYRLKENLQLLY